MLPHRYPGTNPSTYGQPGHSSSMSQTGHSPQFGQPGYSSSMGQAGHTSQFGQPGFSSSMSQTGHSPQFGQPGYSSNFSQSNTSSPSYGQPGYGQTTYSQPSYPPQGAYNTPGLTQGYPPTLPVINVSTSAVNLMELFRKVDRNGSGRISSSELQSALASGMQHSFNPETVRLMINMFDRNQSGELEFEEFKNVWKYVEDWKHSFLRADHNRSGSVDHQELSATLQASGFNLSPSIVAMLIRKFDRYGTHSMAFDDFIQCCVMLQLLTNAFKAEDVNQTGIIQVPYEKFLHMAFSVKL
ncbi:programmed cell death protein 6-like [Zophobas morio]|uniref:programmed cell death protein 6-like n=1 Tax=Zophobas morio TaxID=2755281 RepID=UPI003083CF89